MNRDFIYVFIFQFESEIKKVIDDFVRRYNNSESATLILIGLKNAIIIAFRNLRNE